MTEPVGLRWTPPAPEAVDLEAGRFERSLDRSWRRTSYTGIVAAAHDARVASEPEEEGTVDEPDVTGAPLGAGGDALEATGAPPRATAGPLNRRTLRPESPVG